MKYHYYLITAVLLVFTGCSAPLESANDRHYKIVVVSGDGPDNAYRNAAMALLDMGYAISYSDETLRTLTTDFRKAAKGYGLLGAPIYVKVNVSVSNTEPASVTYRGTYKLSEGAALGDDERPVVKRGASGSPAHSAWNELELAASSYPGGEISQ